MKVMVIGSGGREHALAWKIGKSHRVDRVFVAPGNAGTAMDAENVSIAADDIAGLVGFANQNKVDLTVVGPEAPLCAGIVDAFQEKDLRIFGPSRNAARLEGSKVFCKKMLRRADVPTAEFREFETAEAAERFVKERYGEHPDDVPLVVKADGLAAGKGAIVCGTLEDALLAIERIARSREFGAAGDRFIIEDRLVGQEASILAITDGKTILMLPPAQDHKRAGDGDTGPNTGGMGAYCPTPAIDDAMLAWVEEHVLVPTVHMMKRSRNPFRGILYAGLMLTPQGPRVLEYNVRFGDPECQPLLMRLQSDFVDVIEATVNRELDQIEPLKWDPRPSICVVMASEGYPEEYEKGKVIRGLDAAAAVDDVKVFHAGTKMEAGEVMTNGGRVLGVTALGDSISTAKLAAYRAVKCIRWEGAWCRKDISDRAIELNV